MRRLPRLSLARIIVLLAALVVGYFAFSTIGDPLLSHRLNQEEQQLNREIFQLERQQAQLEAIRDYLRTDEYIEGVARRLLGLVRPGETLFIVSSSAEATPAPTPQPDDEPRPWWEQLYGP